MPDLPNELPLCGKCGAWKMVPLSNVVTTYDGKEHWSSVVTPFDQWVCTSPDCGHKIPVKPLGVPNA